MYYDDYGRYPTSTAECLDPHAIHGTTAPVIGPYLRRGVVPSDPLETANTDLCKGSNLGRYWYRSLSKNGISNNAYILFSDVETIGKANSISGNIAHKTTVAGAQEQLLGYESRELITAEQSDPATTLYCIIGE